MAYVNHLQAENDDISSRDSLARRDSMISIAVSCWSVSHIDMLKAMILASKMLTAIERGLDPRSTLIGK
jgi:hypothetical protein